jgi:tripeptidyl-peptidase I
MRLIALSQLLLAAKLASGLSFGHDQLVVHEKREQYLSDWTKVGKPPADATLRLRIGLAQSNVDGQQEFLEKVSSPNSESYGQYWTPEDVIKTFAPSESALSDTLNWLLFNNISSRAVKLSSGRNWITVETSIAAAEKLLNTRYGLYRNARDGSQAVACDEYSIPQSIREHIDLIMPTIHHERLYAAQEDRRVVKRLDVMRAQSANKSLETCSQVTTPACLRAL